MGRWFSVAGPPGLRGDFSMGFGAWVPMEGELQEEVTFSSKY